MCLYRGQGVELTSVKATKCVICLRLEIVDKLCVFMTVGIVVDYVVVQSSDSELWTFVSLNLALVYLRTNRQEEFIAVLNTVEPERLSNTSYVIFTWTILSLLELCLVSGLPAV